MRLKVNMHNLDERTRDWGSKEVILDILEGDVVTWHFGQTTASRRTWRVGDFQFLTLNRRFSISNFQTATWHLGKTAVWRKTHRRGIQISNNQTVAWQPVGPQSEPLASRLSIFHKSYSFQTDPSSINRETFATFPTERNAMRESGNTIITWFLTDSRLDQDREDQDSIFGADQIHLINLCDFLSFSLLFWLLILLG